MIHLLPQQQVILKPGSQIRVAANPAVDPSSCIRDWRGLGGLAGFPGENSGKRYGV